VNSVEKGRKGEEIAARYLDENGYSIVKRNFKAYGAEIDIIAIKDNETVFAEVKYSNAFGFYEMERMIDRSKCKKIIRASKGYLEKYPVLSERRVRYDLLYIDISGNVAEHVTNAFTETDYS